MSSLNIDTEELLNMTELQKNHHGPASQLEGILQFTGINKGNPIGTIQILQYIHVELYHDMISHELR